MNENRVYVFIQQNQFFHLYTVKNLTTPPSILLESDSCQALCPCSKSHDSIHIGAGGCDSGPIGAGGSNNANIG